MKMTGAFPRVAGRGMALALLFGAALIGLPAAHAAGYWTTNSLAFARAQSSVTQAQGSVVVAVRRTGDSSQAASIRFWSANGTAVAGRDYSASSGTLSWPAGDSSAKIITIAVTKSPAFAGSRSFNLWLGWVSNATTGSQDTTKVVISGGGSTSTSTSGSAGSTPSNVLKIAGTPSTSVTAGSGYHFQPSSSAPAGKTVAFSVANKPHWATFSTVNGALNGTPSATDVGTTPNIGISASDGATTSALPAFSLTVKAAASAPPSSGGSASRPAYNTGNGFFVVGGKLYDPNGNEFRIRGVNRTHWDLELGRRHCLVGCQRGAHLHRLLSTHRQEHVSLIQDAEYRPEGSPDRHLPAGDSSGATSCSSDPAGVGSGALGLDVPGGAVDDARSLPDHQCRQRVGPSNSTVWRDSYINAIAQAASGRLSGSDPDRQRRLRGQDDADLLQYSQAVLNSDPQRNLIFSIHLYATANDHTATIRSIAKGNPIPSSRLASNAASHPFAPSYKGSNNELFGYPRLSDPVAVQGMTAVNGEQPAPPNVGGVPGAWTVTLSVDSTHWGDYGRRRHADAITTATMP